ncbi:MAG: phosphatidylserine decarboxylase family protein [Thermodesulfovibrionales bacterium]|nr:phosphatidylserine decarboxylase family protein [Thermodesulfovibrionales bacterium]
MNALAPEGYPFIIAFSIITVFTYIIGNIWIALLSFILTAFMLYFFRDPERQIPDVENIFVSPADGKVILIKNIFEDQHLKTDAIEISIFMSPFNVHVNRAPCDGKIKNVQHNKGKFMTAYKDEASFKNENIEMTLETKYGDILVRQVAGYVARRAVCRAKAGDSLRRGERYGIIKFSSRLDVYLPKDTELKVKLGDRVKAGETVIGIIK